MDPLQIQKENIPNPQLFSTSRHRKINSEKPTPTSSSNFNLPLSCKENRFVSYLIKNRIAKDCLGNLEEKFESIPLIYLDSNEQGNIEKFLNKPFSILGNYGFDFGIKATPVEAFTYIIQCAQDMGLELEDIVIVGSAVTRFLGLSYFLRMFESLNCPLTACFDEKELEQIRIDLEQCGDYDIRFIFRNATIEQMRQLSNKFIQFFLDRLKDNPLSDEKQKEGLEILKNRFPFQFEDFQRKPHSIENIHYFLTRAFVYEKYFSTSDQLQTQFSILGFGDRNTMKLECLLYCKIQQGRSYLSYNRSLAIPINSLLPAIGSFQPKRKLGIIPTHEFNRGLKALTDELSKIFRPSSIVEETFWIKMLTANTKGFCCNIPGKPKQLLDCFLKSIPANKCKEEYIYVELDKCMKNHLGNSPFGRIALCWMVLSELQNELEHEKLQCLIDKMFKELPMDDLGDVKAIAQIIQSPFIHFKTKNALLNLVAFVSAYDKNNKIYAKFNQNNQLPIFQLYLKESDAIQFCMMLGANIAGSYQYISELLIQKENSKENKALKKLVSNLLSQLLPPDLDAEKDPFLKSLNISIDQDQLFYNKLIRHLTSTNADLQWLATLFTFCLPSLVQNAGSLDPFIQRFPRFIQRSLSESAKSRWVNNLGHILEIRCPKQNKEHFAILVKEARQRIEENHQSPLEILEYWILFLAKTEDKAIKKLAYSIWKNGKLEVEDRRKIGKNLLKQLVENENILVFSIFPDLCIDLTFESKCEELVWFCQIAKEKNSPNFTSNSFCRFSQKLICDLTTPSSNVQLNISFTPLIDWLQREDYEIAFNFLQMLSKRNCVVKKNLASDWLTFCQNLFENTNVLNSAPKWLVAKKIGLWSYRECHASQEFFLIELLKSWPLPNSIEEVILFNNLFAESDPSISVHTVFLEIKDAFYQNLTQQKKNRLADALQGISEEKKLSIELRIINKQISSSLYSDACNHLLNFEKQKNLSESHLLELRKTVLQLIEKIKMDLCNNKTLIEFLSNTNVEKSFENGWQQWFQITWEVSKNDPFALQVILNRIYSSSHEGKIDSNSHKLFSNELCLILSIPPSCSRNPSLTISPLAILSIIQILHQNQNHQEIVSLVNAIALYQKKFKLEKESVLFCYLSIQSLLSHSEISIEEVQKIHQTMLILCSQTQIPKNFAQEILLNLYQKIIFVLLEKDQMDWACHWIKKNVELGNNSPLRKNPEALPLPLLKKLLEFILANFHKKKTETYFLELALNSLKLFGNNRLDLWDELLKSIAVCENKELKRKAWDTFLPIFSHWSIEISDHLLHLAITIWIDAYPNQPKQWLIEEETLIPKGFPENCSPDTLIFLYLKIIAYFVSEKVGEITFSQVTKKFHLIDKFVKPDKKLAFLSEMLNLQHEDWLPISIDCLEAFNALFPTEFYPQKKELAEKVASQFLIVRDINHRSTINHLITSSPWNLLLSKSFITDLKTKFVLYNLDTYSIFDQKEKELAWLNLFDRLFLSVLKRKDKFTEHFISCFCNFFLLYSNSYSMSFEDFQRYINKIFSISQDLDRKYHSQHELFVRKIFIKEAISRMHSLVPTYRFQKITEIREEIISPKCFMFHLVDFLESEFKYWFNEKKLDQDSQKNLCSLFYEFIYLQIEVSVEHSTDLKAVALLELAHQSSFLKNLEPSKICEIHLLAAAASPIEASFHKKYRQIFKELNISNKNIFLGVVSAVGRLLELPANKFLNMAYQMSLCYYPFILTENSSVIEIICTKFMAITRELMINFPTLAIQSLKKLEILFSVLNRFPHRSKTMLLNSELIQSSIFSIAKKWMMTLDQCHEIDFQSETLSSEVVRMYVEPLEYCIPLFCKKQQYQEFIDCLTHYFTIILKSTNQICSHTPELEILNFKLGAYFSIATSRFKTFINLYPAKTSQEKKIFNIFLKNAVTKIKSHLNGKIGEGISEEFRKTLL